MSDCGNYLDGDVIGTPQCLHMPYSFEHCNSLILSKVLHLPNGTRLTSFVPTPNIYYLVLEPHYLDQQQFYFSYFCLKFGIQRLLKQTNPITILAVMNSLLVLLVLLIASVLTADEVYKYDEHAPILYHFESDGVKIDVLKKGKNSTLNT